MLSHVEIDRYARHLALSEVGEAGQEKLKSSRVLLIGSGGLGSPMALYLAAAGVGTIGLVDYDFVDSSNLQRQILYDEDSIGKRKIFEAKKKIESLNSQINIIPHEEKLTKENTFDILTGYDIIADGSDNFPTRYLVNDASILLGVPYVYGSIYRFSGQVSVLGTKDGPCYRCLYSEPPAPLSVPNCNEDGVLGVLPGVIGTLMATEVLKMLLKIGRPLVGRLLTYDALDMSFREFVIKKNPACPICGEHPTIHGLIDYEEFCNVKTLSLQEGDISVDEYAEIREELDHLLIDVRKPYEYKTANIGGILIPLSELPLRLKEIPRDKDIILVCQEGFRSRKGMEFLKSHGYPRVRNLAGGIKEWNKKIDFIMKH
jgi:molybdopterin/thiamine biosynthesis adenylyltransferase/rhodanese-related sulfurtransferase